MRWPDPSGSASDGLPFLDRALGGGPAPIGGNPFAPGPGWLAPLPAPGDGRSPAPAADPRSGAESRAGVAAPDRPAPGPGRYNPLWWVVVGMTAAAGAFTAASHLGPLLSRSGTGGAHRGR